MNYGFYSNTIKLFKRGISMQNELGGRPCQLPKVQYAPLLHSVQEFFPLDQQLNNNSILEKQPQSET